MSNQTQSNQTQIEVMDSPKRRGRGWVRLLGGIVVLLVGLSLAGAIYEPVAEAADIQAYPSLGQQVLKEMIEAGKVRPIIDRSFPLTDVPDAIRYLETGHARGKVVIEVAERAS